MAVSGWVRKIPESTMASVFQCCVGSRCIAGQMSVIDRLAAKMKCERYEGISVRMSVVQIAVLSSNNLLVAKNANRIPNETMSAFTTLRVQTML